MADVALVVPCFNEAARLDTGAFRDFTLPASSGHALEIVFVDDGSRDATRAVLTELVASMPGRARLVALDRNGGKAEAVRQGVLAAISSTAPGSSSVSSSVSAPRFVGYWDADLATPLAELPRFLAVMDQQPAVSFVVGSRVKLMGRAIERRPVRHYLGRVFATAASQTLGLPIYDTQCGAKLLRITDETAGLFAEPFTSGWIFDVELLARFRDARSGAADRIYELPLDSWNDVAGSKVRPRDFVRSAAALASLWRKYPRKR
jgi:glycosyltransferase involved in cell wall biosynthesis